MPSPLANLQASYANLCAELAEVTADPKPTYTEKGRTVSWEEHYNGIVARIEKLMKIPGVAPEQSQVFTVISVGR